MKKVLITILAILMGLSNLTPALAIDARVRIMDIAHIKGVREN